MIDRNLNYNNIVISFNKILFTFDTHVGIEDTCFFHQPYSLSPYTIHDTEILIIGLSCCLTCPKGR